MTLQMENRSAVVTGGGGALGRAICLALAREGAKVAAIDISDDSAQETARLVREAGGMALAITADVREEGDSKRAVTKVMTAFGKLDTLVNNAGIMPHQDASILDADHNLWDDVFAINLKGTINFTKAATPHIISAGGGAIINMSSFLAFLGCSYPQDAYTSSKGAIISLTRSMAVQLGPKSIRVNAMAPGPIATEHVEKFFADPVARQMRLDRFPLGRFGTPQDVGELACFLASNASSWLTGQVIVLDGGASCNYL